MSDISAGGDPEGRQSSAKDPPQGSDHEDLSKYFVPNKEILMRNLEHMLVWLQGQPHGTQSRSPHSIVTGRSSIQMKGKDGQTVIPQLDSKLDSVALEGLANAIQLGWNHNFSPRIVHQDFCEFKGPEWVFRRRVQTCYDKLDMYDFDKVADGDDIVCVRILNTSGDLSFVTTPRYPYATPAGSIANGWPWNGENSRQNGLLCLVRPMWIDSSKGIIGFDSLAILFDILTSKHWGDYGCNAVDDRGLLKENCPHDFVAAYANPWPSDASRNWVSQQVLEEGPFSLQYHARSSVTIQTPSEGKGGDCPTGLLCERQSSILPMLGKDFRLVERRYSISLRSHFANFSLVVLEDPVTLDPNIPPLFMPHRDGQGGSKYYDILFTSEQRGIAQFQYLICRMTESWYHDWSTTLSQIDDMITIKAHDLINSESRQNLMYDDRKLQRSECYFSLLQLLRLFRDDVEISFQDLKHFRKEVYARSSQYSRQELEEVGKNWDVVLKLKQERHDALLQKIDRKTREIESLRDGLFNASSIREALKGTQINQILLVFTVVTIIYLPPTFVSTIYALNFMQSNDVAQTRSKFWTACGVISAFTYLAGIVAFLRFDIITWTNASRESSTSQARENRNGHDPMPRHAEANQAGRSGLGLSSRLRRRLRRAANKDEEQGQGKGKENAQRGDN